MTTYPFDLDVKTNFVTAQIISADAIPIATHIKLSAIRNAHRTSTAKGNKNCVIAKITVLPVIFPFETVPVNFLNKRNCMIPVTTPIKILSAINITSAYYL